MSCLTTLMENECHQLCIHHPLNTKCCNHGEVIVFDGGALHGGQTKPLEDVQVVGNGEVVRKIHDSAIHGHIGSVIAVPHLTHIPGKLDTGDVFKLDGACIPGELIANSPNKIEACRCHAAKELEVYRFCQAARIPMGMLLKASSGAFHAKVLMESVACTPETILEQGKAGLGVIPRGTKPGPAMLDLCSGMLDLAISSLASGSHGFKSPNHLKLLKEARKGVVTARKKMTTMVGNKKKKELDKVEAQGQESR